MKKNELLNIMTPLGFHPSRNLGQNFLIDDNLLQFIVRKANIVSGESVLEVGPGFGALTRYMLEAGAIVTAIEFDYRLAQWLRENFNNFPKFTLIEGDACKVDLKALTQASSFRLIANLPYSISSPLILKMIELENPPCGMVVMLQKEVGERFAAQPESKEFGAISIMIQHCYQVEITRIVPPQVFFPPPEVGSAIITFTAKKEIPTLEERQQLAKVVKQSFSQRRKKMCKLLSQLWPREWVEKSMTQLHINLDSRAEQISTTKFIELTQLLHNSPENKNSH